MYRRCSFHQLTLALLHLEDLDATNDAILHKCNMYGSSCFVNQHFFPALTVSVVQFPKAEVTTWEACCVILKKLCVV
jgi:hypothetical protein